MTDAKAPASLSPSVEKETQNTGAPTNPTGRDELVERVARALLHRRGFGFYTDPMEGGQDAFDLSLDAMEDARAALTTIEASRNEGWIVVNIGCIECGVSSNIVGVFTDRAEATAIAQRLDDSHSWREGGQNSFAVFPMPPLNAVADEYQLSSGGPPSALSHQKGADHD